MQTIVKACNLNKTYMLRKEQKTAVLKNIDVSIEKGEFVAIMGASGSGKTTLLYTLSGLLKPSSGHVRLLNTDIENADENDLAKLRLSSVGYIFQNGNLLRSLNINDNILLPAYKLGKEKPGVIQKYAKKLMHNLGIENIAANEITQVSGGQLQRAAICRALINKPQILFADEPTGALNSTNTKEVMNIITEINAGGTTALLVTHDHKVAARANRVLYMKDGNISKEICLQKNKGNTEKQLADWLACQGF